MLEEAVPVDRRPMISLARDVHLQLGGGSLTPAIAKLYSQHTRATAGGTDVNYWRADEAMERLADAVRLVDASLAKRDIGDGDWQLGMRRAGEILEWLSHPRFEVHGAPTRLLSAAAYQLAGQPAMASSLLERGEPDDGESRILQSLLKSDFPSLLQRLSHFWSSSYTDSISESVQDERSLDLSESRVERVILEQLASALGVLCAQVRWGNVDRFDKALEQLVHTCNAFLYSGDTYSWLLSRLVVETAKDLNDRLLRICLDPIHRGLNDDGERALELYVRHAYRNRRSLIWPSQRIGLERLRGEMSFALCTPTGSGKTMVAEVAFLQGLFAATLEDRGSLESGETSALGMYLVPSKALAAEVEAKLSQILSAVTSGDEAITVTGLYGGTDWGPTDAWLTREGRTVLICTYEKAEAILRFLGPMFLNRLRLIVIDEAHAVEFDGRFENLVSGESRSLRLESLAARLLAYSRSSRARIIALSAVAGDSDNTLASWISGGEAGAVTSEYRSTRQLVGRLECLRGRRFEIQYDLLNGASLEFSEQGKSDRPFISDAFPPFPCAPQLERGGPEKRLRPYLFWAALHLVDWALEENTATVMIFAPQQIGGYAADLLQLLEVSWADVDLPYVFTPPSSLQKAEVWTRCLNACADYFGEESREYRLLKHGIVVHHGRMPRSLSRLLVEVIEQRIVRIVLATSTLAEGVNLPFEVLLVPSLRRGQNEVSARELGNLVGRTGRPGVATEGKTLVLLENPANDWPAQLARRRYHSVIGSLSTSLRSGPNGGAALSPLAELLNQLKINWERLPGQAGLSFDQWLSEVEPLRSESSSDPISQSLDALDSMLLSAIVELESLAGQQIDQIELESRLSEIWSRTYACFASTHEAELSSMFITRGLAIHERVYPDPATRRRFYRSGASPSAAKLLFRLQAKVTEHLKTGWDYTLWSNGKKLAFIADLVRIMKGHPGFRGRDSLSASRKSPSWDKILHWWLDPNECPITPSAASISNWYNFIYQNLDYRFNWGLSSVLALEFDEVIGGSEEPLRLENWPDTGLPWIAFWIKELIAWGTLDPVAAYLLSRRITSTRGEALELAQHYYHEVFDSVPNDHLHPVAIRQWSDGLAKHMSVADRQISPGSYHVDLLRDFSNAEQSKWRVVPVESGGEVIWFDVAGFPLARCSLPRDWNRGWIEEFDYWLFDEEKIVRGSRYI